MEIVFLTLSIILSLIAIYGMGRMVYNHKQLIRAYKTSEFLFIAHIVMGIFLIMFLFVILCACNNTFWKLPYLTV